MNQEVVLLFCDNLRMKLRNYQLRTSNHTLILAKLHSDIEDSKIDLLEFIESEALIGMDGYPRETSRYFPRED